MMHKRRGTILITALWILAILSILALGIGFRISVEARLAKYSIDRIRARYLAMAGLVKIEERIYRASNVYDSIRECGISLTPEERADQAAYSAIFNGSLGDGGFRLALSDEERRIDINCPGYGGVKDEVILTTLIDSLTNAGANPQAVSASKEIAHSIVMWRRDAPDASEDDYYESLGYKRKRGNYAAVEELALVKGVTPRIFNLLKDYVTIYADKININTAPVPVLTAVGLGVATAQQIVNYRNGPDGVFGTKDDLPFGDASKASIESVIGRPVSANETAIISALTVKSNYFRIESAGTVSSSKIGGQVTVIVMREQGKWPALKSYREY